MPLALLAVVRPEQRRPWTVAAVIGAVAWAAIGVGSNDGREEVASERPTTTTSTAPSTTERIGSTTTERREPPGLGAIPDPDEPLDGFGSAPGLLGGLSLFGAGVFDVDDLLADLDVRDEGAGAGYDRDLFDPGSCTRRAEVLLSESTRPARRSGCTVTGGEWLSVYDGYRTDDPDELEVDHLVALHEAWVSGAVDWSPARRQAFATDVGHPGALVAVTAAMNLSKSDKDPARWQPPSRAAWCAYAADWITVKVRWGLSADRAEVTALRNMLAGCGATPTTTTSTTTAPPPPPTTAAPVPLVPPTTAGGGCDPSYPDVCIPPAPPDLDCGDIPYGMFRVLPPDPHGFDGNDNDGWGCESN